jgi:hypothetical protein
MLKINGVNDQSIGYTCPGCRLFNCNTVNVIFPESLTLSSDCPFFSGVSTVANKHILGKVLDTGNATKINHDENMRKQQQLLDEYCDEFESHPFYETFQ